MLRLKNDKRNRNFKFLRAQVRQLDNLRDSTEENLAKNCGASDQVGEIDHKDACYCVDVILACNLPSCICIYIINFGPDPCVDFDY